MFHSKRTAGVNFSWQGRLKFQCASRDVFLLLILMFKNMYIGEKNASCSYQVGHNKIGNWFMICCTSGDTLKGVVKWTFGIYSSCLHSMTKERPCEQERWKMNEARNGKLPLVQAAQMCVVRICKRLHLVFVAGRNVGSEALQVLLCSILQPPGPVKAHLSQGFLCLLSSQGCYPSSSKERWPEVQVTVAQD
jgi:hypothetical protein